MENIFDEIPGHLSWKEVSLVAKGYSSDRKYCVKTMQGEKLLLRISDISGLEEKKKEYEMVQKYAQVGFPMSEPIAFGTCNQNQNIYMILSWVEGCDLEQVLGKLPEEEQYLLGRQAGQILKKIHQIPVENTDIPAETKAAKKMQQLERYVESAVRVPNDETAIRYVQDHISEIWSERPVYQHGDFHPGNLIYMPDGKIGVIDFNRWEVGDPYEEFYKLESFGIENSVPYCIGQIDAYFEDQIPEKFWEILAVYVAHASLYSIKWAEKFGPDDVAGMVQRWETARENYDDFRTVIPKWYDENLKRKYQE